MFDFPAAQTGDTVTNGPVTYYYDGQKWTLPGSPPVQPPNGGGGTGTLINNGSILIVQDSTWPTSPAGLANGAFYSNGGVAMVNGTTSPNPAASPVYFSSTTSADLLALGGTDLPLTVGASGSGQLWNNHQIVGIS